MLKFGLVAIWIALLAVVLSSVIRSEKVDSVAQLNHTAGRVAH